jgi:hypothetical protein
VGLLGVALMLVENEVLERKADIATSSKSLVTVLKASVLASTVLLDVLLVLRYRSDGRVLQLQSAVPSRRAKSSLWRPLLLLLELLVCSFHVPPGVGGRFEVAQLHGAPRVEDAERCGPLQRGIDLVKRGDGCYLVYAYPVEALGA